jgi:hypothetical protein
MHGTFPVTFTASHQGTVRTTVGGCRKINAHAPNPRATMVIESRIGSSAGICNGKAEKKPPRHQAASSSTPQVLLKRYNIDHLTGIQFLESCLRRRSFLAHESWLRFLHEQVQEVRLYELGRWGWLATSQLFSPVDEALCRTRIAPRQNSGRVKTKAPLTHQNHGALRLNSPPPSTAQFHGKNMGEAIGIQSLESCTST